MAPRSRNLVAPTALGSSAPQLLYTAPLGFFVLLHSIRVVNADVVERPISMGYSNPPELAPLFVFAPVQAFGVLVDQTWQVMPDGGELWAQTVAGGVLFVSVNGAVLGP